MAKTLRPSADEAMAVQFVAGVSVGIQVWADARLFMNSKELNASKNDPKFLDSIMSY
jgi:hypothetical protein